jgi:hypothetical protein
MFLSVEKGNSRYRFIGDLASICAVKYLSVSYGGEEFVSKNVSKCGEFLKGRKEELFRVKEL